jgi:hypothetical protein
VNASQRHMRAYKTLSKRTLVQTQYRTQLAQPNHIPIRPNQPNLGIPQTDVSPPFKENFYAECYETVVLNTSSLSWVGNRKSVHFDQKVHPLLITISYYNQEAPESTMKWTLRGKSPNEIATKTTITVPCPCSKTELMVIFYTALNTFPRG